MPIRRVLVANRGEIAARTVRTCHTANIEAVVVVSEADRTGLAARLADRVVCVGPARATDSYLNAHVIVAAALAVEADAVHPGYGFLAESAEFAELCEQHDLVFIGPSPDVLRKTGDKIEAKTLARAAGLETVPSSTRLDSAAHAVEAASDIGFPVVLKAAGGGGGRGIRVLHSATAMGDAFQAAAAEADASFGIPDLYLEKYLERARHIEVQVLGDSHGQVIHLGDRDCSIQRRFQKLVEEAPATSLSRNLREKIATGATDLASLLGYEGAGTVEYIVDEEQGEAYFIEMNSRIQVEHPVTELLTGIDLVAEQLKIASGEGLDISQEDVSLKGHAIECRVLAETPYEFVPSPGRIDCWSPPTFAGVRVDTHCYTGYVIPPFYDSLLAKLVVWGPDRTEAIRRTRQALREFHVQGPATTIPFLLDVMHHTDYVEAKFHTRWLERIILERPDQEGVAHAGD